MQKIGRMKSIEKENMIEINWLALCYKRINSQIATVSPSYEGRVMQSIPYGCNCFADEVNYNPNTP